MTVNQLVCYSIMITIVIINTVNGNCPEDELTPIVTITNTSVNATPGMNLLKSVAWPVQELSTLLVLKHIKQYEIAIIFNHLLQSV